MRKFWFGLAASGMLALATTANAQIVWQDHFDTYSLGPLAAQSDWEEWYASSNVDADVTQDVFVHLLTRAADYDAARGPLSPWLLGIARNFVRRRTGTRELALGEDPDAPAAPLELATPETSLIARAELDALRRAIAALPPHYRDVLVLVELAERSYAEVAAICGLELNTVRSRLFRARALLSRWLAIEAQSTGARSSAA